MPVDPKEIPTAILDDDFADRWLFYAAAPSLLTDDLSAGNLMDWYDSACALLNNQIAQPIVFHGDDPRAILLTVLNRTDAPLTWAIDTNDAYYGQFWFVPRAMQFDADSRMLLPVGAECTIPAGRPADPARPDLPAKVGVGVFVAVANQQWYGAGFALTITGDALGDRIPLYVAVQHALKATKGVYASVALSTDIRQYGSVRDFYDKACDDVRNQTAHASHEPRAGDPGRCFEAIAHRAGVAGNHPVDIEGEYFSRIKHIQAVLAISNYDLPPSAP